MGELPEDASNLVVSLTMTLLAGRLMPAAKVGVATMTFSFPARKLDST